MPCVLAPAADRCIRWGPTLADGVTCQGATSYRDGWEVYVTTCNAAEAKDSPRSPVHPPLGLPQLAEIATSDVWFA